MIRLLLDENLSLAGRLSEHDICAQLWHTLVCPVSRIISSGSMHSTTTLASLRPTPGTSSNSLMWTCTRALLFFVRAA